MFLPAAGCFTERAENAESGLASANGALVATLTWQSDWGTGFCANVSLTNTGTSPTSSWTVVLNLNQTTLAQTWNATGSTTSTLLTFVPLGWNGALASGASTSFGFCGSAANGSTRPTLASVSAVGGGSSGSGGTGGGAGATGGARATGGAQATGGRATGGNATGGIKATGGNGTGGSTSNQPPPLTNGQPGYATRYWDCCKPACGWSANVPSGRAALSCSVTNQTLSDANAQSACGGGSAYTCWSQAPWAINDSLSYGFAALHGSAFKCGQCYELQFDGHGRYNANDPGSVALKGKHMVVQVLNTGSDVNPGQFDMLIPGGGPGAFNACSQQFPGANLGSQYGGLLTQCGVGSSTAKSCVLNACQAAFSGKADMLAGCLWFGNWFAVADDPTFLYQKVACPAALMQRSGLSDPG